MNEKWETVLEFINATAAIILIVVLVATAAATPGFLVIMAANAVFPALAIPLGFWSSVAATFLLATLFMIF